MEIPLKGSIRDYSLPKVLVQLNRKRATGTLSVSTPNFTKKIYLIKGDAVFASSSYEDDRLGEMLLKAGKITVEQYDKSVEILKATKKRQGAILVELGYLIPKDLFWGVKYQVKEIIYSLFQLEEGEFELAEGDVPTQEVITLKMSMGNLIYEGVKKIENWTRIRQEMPDTGIVLRLSEDPISLFQNVELSPNDKKMLPLIDGRKTIKEIVDSSWTNSFEAMKTIYVLWSIGILEEKKGAPREIKETTETVSFEDLMQPFAEEEEAFMKRVGEIYSNLDMLKMHELLEIDKNSDAETIKKNYYRLSRDFHPDRHLSASDATLIDKLTAISDAITTAYSKLKDDSGRKEYFSASAGPAKEKTAAGKESDEEQFKKGVDEFKKNNFEAAVVLFKEAAGINPKKTQYWSYLSLALTKIPHRLKEAEEPLLEAIKLEPLNGEHYANLGLLYLKTGLTKRAAGQFEKALKFDPGNIKAQKGLKQIRG
ncbi:MAG: Zn finger domain-containing DnaJ-class molecular chaperone [Nitrospirae bacterium]|nr:MAG: Zn finger domain-containing DnaJ-class molecular chaperone [Nitrospirota bacterium]